MVAGLAFLATAIATVFAQATAVRWSRSQAPHQGAWTFALALFALASAALATGASTGWDRGTFRAFYLLGAVLNVPWLALGTVYLLMGRTVGDRVRAVLLVFTGVGIGVMLAAPIHGAIAATGHPRRQGPLRRAAARARRRRRAGSARSSCSAARRGRRSGSRGRGDRAPGASRAATRSIALGTLVLSSGGLLQGVVGSDEAFALTLAIGIAVIYAGFVVASGAAAAGRGRVRRRRRRRRRVRRRQLATQQLARERPRQLVDELDARRELVTREAAARVPQQLDRVGMRDRAWRRRTRRPSRPCADAARRPPRRRRRRRCCASTCSTSPGIHVEARDDHDVLGALDERQPAVGVGDADVAGVQPAVGAEHPRRRLRVAPVAREHVRAAHEDLAGIAVEHVVAVGVDEAHLDARQAAGRPIRRAASRRPRWS